MLELYESDKREKAIKISVDLMNFLVKEFTQEINDRNVTVLTIKPNGLDSGLYSFKTEVGNLEMLSVRQRDAFDSLELAFYQNYTEPYEIKLMNSKIPENDFFISSLMK